MDRRYIAPIVITVIAVIYFIGMALAFFAALIEGMVLFLFLVFIPVGAAALTVYMLLQRIEEIKGGEEDEASKY